MARYLRYVIRKARRSLRKRRSRRRQPVTSRRRFLLQGVGLLAGGLLLAGRLIRASSGLPPTNRLPLRPPSAAANDAHFRASCIRCGLCGTVCENGCIRFFGLEEGKWGVFTPYIDARQRACTLCMSCTQICPSGALSPLARDLKTIAASVHMGTAVVDPDRCLSYLGRICGYCHDACPLPQKAIRLTPPAKPVVLADGCVGCGRCVEFCPQTPTAIDVRRVPA
jgi:ferredoxin-type protein NapG